MALSCQRRGICPSCHAKRLTLWSDELVERLLPDVAYRQWALTIPKRLRVFFRYDGMLFKGLSALFADILIAWMRTVLGRDDIRPGVVACDQTFGTLLGYHPHQHLTASDGAFTTTGEFVPMPRLKKKDVDGLTEALRRRVLLWLTRRGKITPATRRSMRSWPNSGFHLDGSVRIPADQRERLRKVLCYAHRHPFSGEGVTYKASTETVIYRAKKRHGLKKRNFEVFDALDFIAALADHIPHRRRHRVRYYAALHPRYRSSLPTPEHPPDYGEPAHLAKLSWGVEDERSSSGGSTRWTLSPANAGAAFGSSRSSVTIRWSPRFCLISAYLRSFQEPNGREPRRPYLRIKTGTRASTRRPGRDRSMTHILVRWSMRDAQRSLAAHHQEAHRHHRLTFLELWWPFLVALEPKIGQGPPKLGKSRHPSGSALARFCLGLSR